MTLAMNFQDHVCQLGYSFQSGPGVAIHFNSSTGSRDEAERMLIDLATKLDADPDYTVLSAYLYTEEMTEVYP